MVVVRARFVTNADGTPGVLAAGPVDALWGMGVLHARHRPLQALLLYTAGRAALAATIAPRADLVQLDATVHRLDLLRRGRRAAEKLSPFSAARVDAYLEGFNRGLGEHGLPFELRAIAARIPPPDRAALLSGFLVSAYLGLAEGQERMERLIVDALHEGADPRRLERMFAPHLDGWSPDRIRAIPRASAPVGFAAHGLGATGGSNAWAVAGSRTREGRPLLAGDPHLAIGQLPSLFFEMGVRLDDDYWIGATIPGLPSVAVGRNRNVAWSGTFAVADNVDAFVDDGAKREPRRVAVGRRGLSPLALQFEETPRGTRDRAGDGPAFALRWTGCERPEEAFDAYFGLLESKDAAGAEAALAGAHTLSLHFVLADRGGDVRYKQVGCIPRRTGGWSGLYPSHSHDRGWSGRYVGAALPRAGPEDGFVLTANEARRAPDGGVLSTLGLAPYRYTRIRERLAARRDHDVASMMLLQRDLHSIQARRIAPRLRALLGEGSLSRALAKWDCGYSESSRGAHAFEIAYLCALRALSLELGGAWFEHQLDRTELRVWWSTALDRTLLDDKTYEGPLGAAIAARLASIKDAVPAAWGQVQTFRLPNLVLGGLPDFLRFDRGPYALEGSMATVCQGSIVRLGDTKIPVGPAYRFVTDLGEDCAYTSVPGGIDGSRFGGTYACWLHDHLGGRHHRLVPPEG